MGLNDLLPQNQKGKNKKSSSSTEPTKRTPGRPKEKEGSVVIFSVYSNQYTKDLLLRIQEIINKTESRKVSQGDLVREGLELLAKEINLDEREKKYAELIKKMKS